MASASGIQAGNAFVKISAQDAYSSALSNLENKLKSIGAAAAEVGKNLALAGAGAIAGILATTKAYAEMGDAIAKASTRTGIAAGTLSELAYAASQSGTDLEGLEKGLGKLSQAVVKAAGGNEEAQASFQRLGLSAKDMLALTPDEQFKRVAEAISRVESPTLKVALAMDIFGKSGRDLIPLMADGRAGIDELQKAARDLGVSMSTQDARAAEEFGDRLDDLGKVALAGAFQIGAAAAPAIRQYAVSLTSSISAVVNWIKANREQILLYAEAGLKAAAYTVAIGGTLFALGKLITIGAAVVGTIKKVSEAVSVVTSLSKASTAAAGVLAANPITIAVLGIGALVAAGVAMNEYYKIAARAANQKLEIEVDGAQKLAEEADEARAGVLSLINTLKELNGKTSLEPEDIGTAQAAIAALTARYGDLGLSIDTATGKLVGFGAAQQKINEMERGKEIAEQQKILDAAEAARQKAARDYKEQVNEHAAYGDQGGSKYNPLTYIPKLSSHTQANADAEEIDKQAKIAAEARRKIEELKKPTADPFKGIKPAATPLPDADGLVTPAAQAKKDAEDRKKLEEVNQKLRDAALSEEQKKINGVNDAYKEQMEILKRLYASADKRGDTKAKTEIQGQQGAATKTRDADVAKIQSDAKVVADKKASDAAKELLEKQQAQNVEMLKLQQEQAEKTGDVTKSRDLKKQVENAEFEKHLTDLYGTDDKAKAAPRSIHKQTVDLPEVHAASQGIFDTKGGGQALQSNSVQDRIAKAAEETAKNTKKIAGQSNGSLFMG